MDNFDPTNKFLVGGTAGTGELCILNPPLPRQLISKEDAVNLACWLLVISGVERHELLLALTAVEDT